MEDVDARTGFMHAARLTASVVGSAAVAEHWPAPSILAGLSVGGLAGHTYLATRLVVRHLDQPEPLGAHVRRPGEYYRTMRVDDDAQLKEDVHRAIRQDGEYVARRGAEALAAKFIELVDRLDRRLLVEHPDRLLATPPPGTAARLDDFLANRTIELLVHADDLAASAGLPPLEPPTDAATLAITSLVAVARERLGDRAVLRALSGRDRPSVEELRVL
jgi:Mycothiol maleylpyruvate isomerase N-terminal domain